MKKYNIYLSQKWSRIDLKSNSSELDHDDLAVTKLCKSVLKYLDTLNLHFINIGNPYFFINKKLLIYIYPEYDLKDGGDDIKTDVLEIHIFTKDEELPQDLIDKFTAFDLKPEKVSNKRGNMVLDGVEFTKSFAFGEE